MEPKAPRSMLFLLADALRGLPKTPRFSQDVPRRSRDPPKTPQDPPKTVPGASQHPPKSDFGLHFGAILLPKTSLRAILPPFWSHLALKTTPLMKFGSHDHLLHAILLSRTIQRRTTQNSTPYTTPYHTTHTNKFLRPGGDFLSRVG